MRRQLGVLACVYGLLLAGASAGQSLIGDTVRFQCTNCGPPLDVELLVTDQEELETFPGQAVVDITDNDLRVRWQRDETIINSRVNFVWNDLDWSGFPQRLKSAQIDPASTWGTDPDVLISFTDDSVTMTNNGLRTAVENGTLIIRLSTVPIPEPASAASCVALLAAGGVSRRRVRYRQ